MVRSGFQVKDIFNLPDGEAEYRIAYDPQSKARFADLSAKLEPLGLTAWLSGNIEDCALQIRRRQTPKPSASRVPVIMALLTVLFVIVAGILEMYVFETFAPTIPYYVVFVSYVACVVAILAAHEFGRRYLSEKIGVPPPISYFILGVAGITGFLPSLGVLSRQRAPLLNNDVAFDSALAGPVAVFVISVLLYIISEFASVQSAAPLIAGVMQVGQFQAQFYNLSIVQMGIDALFSRVVPASTGGYIRLSPIADAASVGLFLAFLGLIPVALFEGGQAASAVLRPRARQAASYVCGLGIMIFDFPYFWPVGLFVFALSLVAGSRQTRVQLYDEVSGVSSTRRTIFILVLLLALCCVPIPQNLASIPLG